jgi:hypothetical protein
MSKPLAYQPLNNFGVNGLNTQNNPATLDPTFIVSADNIVLRESGRISFRKGFKQKVVPTGTAIASMVEHNDQGTNKIFASYGTSIYTVDFTAPNAAFADGANIKRTVANSTGDWQFVNFNNRLHCFHSGVAPQRYDGASDTGERWSAHQNATAINDGSNINDSVTTITVDSTVGFPPIGQIIIEDEVLSYTSITATTFVGLTRGVGSTDAATHANNVAVQTYGIPVTVTTFDPSCGMGYYGRLWCGGVTEAKDVVYWSNLLDGDDWIGGDAGILDLSKIWGTDEVVAIAPFYGQLIIFGKNNIVIYDNPTTVGSLALNEVISGVGCVSRDSVQAIGDDLVFLSATGLRSLLRTAEKDKLPLTDLTVNIKDTIIRNIGQSTNVKSVYVENEGIYILSFVDKNINYVFDFKHITPQETPRITTWSFGGDREPASMINTELYDGLLIGQKDGSIAGYEGYFDTDLSFVSSAVVLTNFSYTADISSIWLTMGEGVTSSLLKNMILILEGGSGATLGLKWYKDFSSSSSPTTIINLAPTTTGTTSLWGASSSLYGATTVTHTHVAATHPSNSRYTPVFGLREYRTALTGSAKRLKLNFSIVSNGFDASIQDLSIISLQGKIR